MKTLLFAVLLCLSPVVCLAEEVNLNQFRGASLDAVIRHMGVPDKSAQLPDGRTVAEWGSSSNRSAIIPIPGPFALGASIPLNHGDRLTLWFNAQGRVFDGSYETW